MYGTISLFLNQNGTARIFVDGMKEFEGSDTSNYSTTQSVLAIGAQVALRNPAYDFIGYIQDVRITKGVARYTSSFTPLALPFSDIKNLTVDNHLSKVSLLMHGNGTHGSTNFVDSSPNPKIITPFNNTQHSINQSKFGGSSIYFDGSSYLKTPYNIIFDPNTSDFTVELWIYCLKYNVDTASCLIGTYSWNNEGGVQNAGWLISLDYQTGYIKYGWGNNGPYLTILSTTTAPDLNAWNHLAVVKKNNQFTLYKNGISISSAEYTTPVTVSKQYLSIGGAGNGGIRPALFF